MSIEYLIGQGGVVCLSFGLCLGIWVHEELPDLRRFLRLCKTIKGER